MAGGRADRAMSKPVALAIIAALAFAAATAGFLAIRVSHNTVPPRPVWTEAKWPFTIDQWGTGRAFNCKAADCGTEVKLCLRAKLGSSNCTNGVADDADLDSMSAFDLVGGEVRSRERWVKMRRTQCEQMSSGLPRERTFELCDRVVHDATDILQS